MNIIPTHDAEADGVETEARDVVHVLVVEREERVERAIGRRMVGERLASSKR